MPWKLVLCGGVTAALIAAPFGTTVQGAVLLIGFLVAAFGGLTGVVKWKPERRMPWLLISACSLFFFTSSTWKVLDAGQQDSASSGMNAANCIYVTAYLLAIVGLWKFARLRTNDMDPTNLIDALVIAGAIAVVACGVAVVPMLTDTALTNETKVANLLFDSLDFALLFMFARVALGPGVRNVSYRLLSMIPLSILVSDQLIALAQADIRFPGILVLTYLVPPVGCAAGAAAAMHPSMVRIATPAKVGIATMTRGRFFIMTVAITVSPLTLLVNPTSYWVWLVPAWLLLVGLTMTRLSGLVRARERAAEFDSILLSASAALVACTSRSEMFESALDGVAAIVSPVDPKAQLAVVEVSSEAWSVVSRRRWPSTRPATPRVNAAFVREIADLKSSALFKSACLSPFDSCEDASSTHLYVSSLVFACTVYGAIVLETNCEFSTLVADAITTLGTRLALAIQTADLSEGLHRQRSERRFRSLVENSSDLLVVVGEGGVPQFMSPVAERVLRWADATQNIYDAIHEADRPAFVALVEAAGSSRRYVDRRRTIECRMLGENGEVRWLEATATDMRDEPDVAGVVINAHDITDRKSLENDLRHRVLHDDLTGIPNRVLLRERLDHAISSRKDGAGNVAVLFVDLDDFKTVNDGLGHGAGDELLKVIAFRIQTFVREHDTAARLGGDEFAVLLERLDSRNDGELVARRLLEVIRQPLDFGGRQIQVGASIGIALVEPGHDSGVLLRNADVAMYEAKHKGKDRVVVFDEAMYVNAAERLDLKADLLTAIDRKEFTLNYQPIVHLETGAISGFEALVRWTHAEKGFISPASFIPLAEETGAIVPLGLWVLREALEHLATWRVQRPDLDLKMSVNVAPRQLQEASIVDDVSRILRETGVDPKSVTLELTESENLDDLVTRDRLTQLGKLGVGIAADDFGSGFASYAALQQLPFSVVKIDRSILLGLDLNYDKAVAQLRSIIDMAHSTGLSVVVEGIEDARQRDLMTSMGCDRGQGFLLGRPSPADTAAELLRANATQTAQLN